MLTYSTVIPTKDRPREAAAAVEDILGQTRLPKQIIVVDASTPPLRLPESIHRRAAAAGVELVVSHRKPSTAAQRNHGVDLVDAAVVLFLDDDVSIESHYVATLLERWERSGFSSFGGIMGSPLPIDYHSHLGLALRRLFMLHYIDPAGGSTTIRRSRKLRFVPLPAEDVEVPAVGAGGTAFRTELVRRHRFDDHFHGYALGEDLEMSFRLGREAPILQTPVVRFRHDWHPRERHSSRRWYYRGRCETYFRLRHLPRSPLDVGAFSLSVVAETALAAFDTLRERDAGHVKHYVKGLLETLREGVRREGDVAYEAEPRSQ
jgi:glycosyltransferase involved in cell wall biosynthesis